MKIEFENLRDHIDEAVGILVAAYAPPPWNEEWSLALARARLNELLVHPGCLSVAGFDRDHMAGFALGTPHTGVAGMSLYLGELVVAPTLQRQGVGKAILSRLEITAAKSGFGSMWLVTERLSTTTHFYGKSGFGISDSLTVLSKRFNQSGA